MTGGCSGTQSTIVGSIAYVFDPVVRMQGMQSLRVDMRWRPEVSISFGDEGPSHKFVLGVDGRNPNLKTLISLSVFPDCLDTVSV